MGGRLHRCPGRVRQPQRRVSDRDAGAAARRGDRHDLGPAVGTGGVDHDERARRAERRAAGHRERGRALDVGGARGNRARRAHRELLPVLTPGTDEADTSASRPRWHTSPAMFIA